MFDDFQKTNGRDARRRLGGSMALAVVLYGSISVVVVAATATARRAVEEKLTQVEFAAPPEPEPPPEPPPEPIAEPPPVEKKARPKVKRQELTPPDEVPDEKPKESDAPLAEAEAPGPLDGFTDGVKEAVAPAPPPPPPAPAAPPPAPEPIKKPSEVSGNKNPRFPPAAVRQGVEGVVVVEFTVLPDGTATEPKIVSGPSVFYEAVLAAVPSWRFVPATQGGKKVRSRMTKKVTFRLEDA
jgi:protein TonB